MNVSTSKALGVVIRVKDIDIQALSFSLSTLLNKTQTSEDIFNILDFVLSSQRMGSDKKCSSLLKVISMITGKNVIADDMALLREVANMVAPFVSEMENLSLQLKDVVLHNVYDYPQNIAQEIAKKYLTKTTKIIFDLFISIGKQQMAKFFGPPQTKINPFLVCKSL